MSIYADVSELLIPTNTLLIADCITAYYGMTHPAPNYYYLKDRRPELYKKLVDTKVFFIDERGTR